MVLMRKRALRNSGASIAGKDLFSGASMRKVWMPVPSASKRMRSNKTVFPTPRKPTKIRLFAELPMRSRSMQILTFSRSSFRPASSGGGVPAPGLYGLVIGFIDMYISKVIEIL